MNSDGDNRGLSEKKNLVQCEHCGSWMLTVEGLRKVCRICWDRLNRAVSLKAELENWEKQKEHWAQVERELWQNKEVG